MTGKLGTITLIGSGEFSDTLARAHRRALRAVGGDVTAAFLDTPAGFELNADEIAARAVEYYAQHLSVAMQVASFKSKADATAGEIAEALGVLRHANLILAGPGSPGYAARNWEGSEVWNMAVSRWLAGAQLVLASAAAIAAGKYCLPVYEIYKAGWQPYWLPGLDLLGLLGLHVAIMPHWNNAEGQSFDTRFCFMGAPRLEALERLLPAGTPVLGIDEYTACVIDPEAGQGHVLGAGQVTIRRAGAERVYPSGESFRLDELTHGREDGAGRAAAVGDDGPGWPSPPTGIPAEATSYLHQLAHALKETSERERQRDLIDQAHDTMHELSAEWTEGDNRAQADITPFVDLLVELRGWLRAAREYGLADEIRDRLAGLGIEIQDTPGGTAWKRSEAKER